MSKKAAKKPEKKLSLWERVTDYTILSDETKDGCRYVTIRTHSGAIVNCKMPIHTEEEDRELSSRLAKQLARIAYPDMDLSECEKIRVVW